MTSIPWAESDFWISYTAPMAVGPTLFAVIFTAISCGYGHLMPRKLDENAIQWLGVLIGSLIFTLLTAHVTLLGVIPGLVFLWSVIRMIGENFRKGVHPPAVVGGGIKLIQCYVAVGAGLLLSTGTVGGAQVGSGVIKKFKPTTLKLIFGLYFLYVSVKFITSYFGIMNF